MNHYSSYYIYSIFFICIILIIYFDKPSSPTLEVAALIESLRELKVWSPSELSNSSRIGKESWTLNADPYCWWKGKRNLTLFFSLIYMILKESIRRWSVKTMLHVRRQGILTTGASLYPGWVNRVALLLDCILKCTVLHWQWNNSCWSSGRW